MRNKTVALVLLLAVLCGCGESSRIDPDAEVTIGGSARAADNSPLSDRPVRLGSDAGGDDLALALLTVGLSCVSGKCSHKVFHTSTDGSGDYSFTVRGRDTQSTFGKVRPQLVSVSAEPGEGQVSGASASARFVVQTPHVSLPALALVDPRLRLHGSGPAVASGWSTSRPGPFVLTFESASPVPVWRTTAVGAGATVDGRLLEDSTGQAVLAGQAEDVIEGSEVTLGWRSPGRAYASAAGGPGSRGARCRWSRPGAFTTDGSCRLTDGDLTEPVSTPSVCLPTAATGAPTSCQSATAVTVLLGASRRPDLLVVRGCGSGCRVSTSGNGRSFSAVGTASGDDATLRLDRRPVVAVQVELGNNQLREVSVWEPLPPGASLRPVEDKALDRLRSPYQVEGRSHLWIEVLAGVLLLLLAMGVAFELGRRRQR